MAPVCTSQIPENQPTTTTTTRVRVRAVPFVVSILWFATYFVFGFKGPLQTYGRPCVSLFGLAFVGLLSVPPGNRFHLGPRACESGLVLGVVLLLAWAYVSNVLNLHDPYKYYTSRHAAEVASTTLADLAAEVNMITIACYCSLGLRVFPAAVAAGLTSYLSIVIGFAVTGQLAPANLFLTRIFLCTIAHAAGIAAARSEGAVRRRQLEQAIQLQEKIQEAERSASEVDRVVEAMLPRSVITRLQRGQVVADSFPLATVLFTDIVGFTQWASPQPATVVVEMLNTMFTGFDQLAERFGAEKIKTIGDAYWCVTGINAATDPQSAARCAVALALELLPVVPALGKLNPSWRDLQIRVGLHSGPVVAGIVGRAKLSYDVFGLTSTFANKMESTGLPGLVHISLATFDLVKDHFQCRSGPVVQAEGLGEVPTFFVVAAKAAAAIAMRQQSVAHDALDLRRSPTKVTGGKPTHRLPSPAALDFEAVVATAEPQTAFRDASAVQSSSPTGSSASLRREKSGQPLEAHSSMSSTHGLERKRTVAANRWGLLTTLTDTPSENTTLLAGESGVGVGIAKEDSMQKPPARRPERTRRRHPLGLRFASKDQEAAFQEWNLVASSLLHATALGLAALLEGALLVAVMILNHRCLSHLGGCITVFVFAVNTTIYLVARRFPQVTHSSYARFWVTVGLHLLFLFGTCSVTLYQELAFPAVQPHEESLKASFMFWQHAVSLTVLSLLQGFPLRGKTAGLTVLTILVLGLRRVAFPGTSVLNYLFAVTAIQVVLLLTCYYVEAATRARFTDQQLMEEECVKIEVDSQLRADLLRQLYPASVIPRLGGDAPVADEVKFASVLFAKVVGLDTVQLQRNNPRELLSILNTLYVDVDGFLRGTTGLEKVKNIGNVYMVTGGVPDASPNHCRELAVFATRLFHAVRDFSRNHPERARLETDTMAVVVGMHVGPVVGAVIGSQHKAIYDVFGDTVNVASRLMTGAAANSIRVSEEFARELRSCTTGDTATSPTASNRVEFEVSGPITVQAKGKGVMTCYELEPKLPDVECQSVPCEEASKCN
eukprot:TRINITY_DN21814_c0_g3_i3.p1 TRINITY_DN21814_c0_g3~~TRINITY_DN21814_c0_g3_i3.p1  ORF type:complete len:1061 (-),score=188.18 TRINITY_DN21814_c0_g3_i3:55-3237(-)